MDLRKHTVSPYQSVVSPFMFNATLSFILASKETRFRKKVQKDVFMYYLKKKLWVS